MEKYATQSKNGIKTKVDVNVKNQSIGALVKVILCGTLVHLIVNVIKHVKLMHIQILKFAHVKIRLFDKLLLTCEDDILNTTETSIVEKKVTFKK